MPTIQLRVPNIVELPPFLHVVEIKSWAKILMGPIKSRPIGMLHLCVGRGGAGGVRSGASFLETGMFLDDGFLTAFLMAFC